MGIDVFADDLFDTWVLLTIWSRVQNNSAATPAGFPNRVLSPSYSWFNHSCAPNAVNIAPLSMLACDTETVSTKTIQKEEEIFVSYLCEEDLMLDRKSRQMKLRSWLGADCRCPRCKSES
jgi:hypothetical protein